MFWTTIIVRELIVTRCAIAQIGKSSRQKIYNNSKLAICNLAINKRRQHNYAANTILPFN